MSASHPVLREGCWGGSLYVLKTLDGRSHLVFGRGGGVLCKYNKQWMVDQSAASGGGGECCGSRTKNKEKTRASRRGGGEWSAVAVLLTKKKRGERKRR